MKVFWLLVFSLIIVGCSSSSKKKSGSERYSRERQNLPTVVVPDLAAETLYNQGLKAFHQKDFPKSLAYFKAAHGKWEGNPRQAEARWAVLRAAVKAGDWIEVVEQTDTMIVVPTMTEAQLAEVYTARIKALETLSDPIVLLKTLTTGMAEPKLKKQYDSFKIRGNEVVESKLTIEQLNESIDELILPEHKALGFFRLGQVALDDKDQSRARSFFGKSLNADPNSDAGKRSADLLSQLESLKKVEPKTIGVVLPMSGKHSGVSQKALRGVQMGLGLYGNNITSFRLAVVDSAGNADNARRGVERLVKEDNVIAVIGSVLSKTASAVSSKTGDLGIPNIALSQKAGITESNNHVFRNSLTSEMQVRHLVRTAIDHYGLKRFAILYPNVGYGVEYANIFWDEVLARGGQIVGSQTYSDKETDFRNPVQRLVGTFYIEDRLDEFKQKQSDWQETQPKKGAQRSAPEEILDPIIDFDGIFIPDSAKAMGQIAAMLAYSGVKNVRLLGTNQWNVDDVAKRAGIFANQLLFVDSILNIDPRFVNSVFVRDYRALFNEDPGLIEIQAYDSALILRHLISQGSTSRESLMTNLTSLKNFPGAIGPLSVNSAREIQRPIMSLTIDNNVIVPVRKILAP